MTEVEILKKELEITKKYFLKAVGIISHLHGGSKKAPKLENEYWRELDGLPAIGGEVLLDEPVLQKEEKVKTTRKSSPRATNGHDGMVWMTNGKMRTLVFPTQVKSFEKKGFALGRGKLKKRKSEE